MDNAAKPTHSRFARRHPKAYLSLHVAIGFLLAAAAAWAFFSIAEDLPEKGFMVHTDVAVTAWLQTHGTEFGESVFSIVSLFGSTILSVILVAAGIFFIVRRDWRHLAVLALTCGGGALLNVALKTTFHRTRPEFASEFHMTSWSFPSGHAMDSLISYGLLSYWLRTRFPRWHLAIRLAGIAVILVIGYSRIYLGVHYLSDVLAGYSAGMVWLIVCITGYDFIERRRVGPAGADE